MDILHKGSKGWELYEVKNTTKVKEYQVPPVTELVRLNVDGNKTIEELIFSPVVRIDEMLELLRESLLPIRFAGSP